MIPCREAPSGCSGRGASLWIEKIREFVQVTVQSHGVLEIWRGWWRNFIVPPFYGISGDKIVYTRLNKATTNVSHNINVHLIKFWNYSCRIDYAYFSPCN